MQKKIDTKNFLLDLKLFGSSKEQLLNILTMHAKDGAGLITVFTPNPEQLMRAKRDQSFAKSLRLADLLLPDGIGLVWSSRILAWRGVKTENGRISALSGRIAGVEVVAELLRWGQMQHKRVLIVGGRNYQQLESEYVRWTSGYRDITAPTAAEKEAVTKLVTEYKPAIVFVALGAPNQEEWVLTHRDLLEKNGVKIAMVVGGAFDMLTGQVPRAPQLVRFLGLEWLYRLLLEPWRWRRQLQLVAFIAWVMKIFVTGKNPQS